MATERYFQHAGVTYGYDATQTELIAAAVAAGWTEATGSWPPAPPAPTLAQRAEAASVSGLTITLTGSITLAATLFPTDPVAQSKIAAMNAMATAGALPTGFTTYDMRDNVGVWHHFTAAQYQAVAHAIAAYVAVLSLIVDENPNAPVSLPASSVTITV